MGISSLILCTLGVKIQYNMTKTPSVALLAFLVAIFNPSSGSDDFGSIEEVQPDCGAVLINTKLIDDSEPLSIQNNIKSWKECSNLCEDFGSVNGCKYWTWYDTAPYEQQSPYLWDTKICELRASFTGTEKLEGAWACTDRKND